MKRKVVIKITGRPAVDGAGVKLNRVLGADTTEAFDPFLMLDAFDSTNPSDYTAGFPMHPHRGIETVSYVAQGNMRHRDTLGSDDTVHSGEVQWMNSGSGVLHEERIPATERMLGVQLWLNLPRKDKLSTPYYHAIHNDEIAEIPLEHGHLRLLAGSFAGHQGFSGRHLSLNYYDIALEEGKSLEIPTQQDASVMLFTLSGAAYIAGEYIEEKTAVKLSAGESVTITGAHNTTHLLFFASQALHEPIAWAGPIVMNTDAELDQAFRELRLGTFVRESLQ